MADAKQSERDSVRTDLDNLVNLAKKLKDICPTTDGLIEVCELATVSDAQLELLIRAISSQGKR
jgi:hypothetical protein